MIILKASKAQIRVLSAQSLKDKLAKGQKFTMDISAIVQPTRVEAFLKENQNMRHHFIANALPEKIDICEHYSRNISFALHTRNPIVEGVTAPLVDLAHGNGYVAIDKSEELHALVCERLDFILNLHMVVDPGQFMNSDRARHFDYGSLELVSKEIEKVSVTPCPAQTTIN